MSCASGLNVESARGSYRFGRRRIVSNRSIFGKPVSREEAFDGEVGELGEEFFRTARIVRDGKIVRESAHPATRGRPVLGSSAKVQQSLRLSPEVIEHFRATGPGWQARIDAVLREHVKAAATAS